MNTPLTSVGADRRNEAPVALDPSAQASKLATAAAQGQQVARTDPLAEFKATRKELEQALTEVNERMQRNGRTLAFSLDEKANRTVIRVTNSSTGEVVRQIPDETVLRIAHSMEALKGMLYDGTS
jgi:flagellar protein FlaG